MKSLFPIVVGLVLALRPALLALMYVGIVDHRPDFKRMGYQIGQTNYGVP
jgi:hypothetical protein